MMNLQSLMLEIYLRNPSEYLITEDRGELIPIVALPNGKRFLVHPLMINFDAIEHTSRQQISESVSVEHCLLEFQETRGYRVSRLYKNGDSVSIAQHGEYYDLDAVARVLAQEAKPLPVRRGRTFGRLRRI
jgi:hypothetical protein